MKIVVISGSKSDNDFVETVKSVLDEFNISYKHFISSAHRSPEFTRQLALEIERTYDIVIVLAGLSAALPGFIASYVTKPVIAVPIPSEMMGIDALFSIIQMPFGVPVASMGIGSKGASNAALFAIRIIAMYDDNVKKQLIKYIKGKEEEIKKLNGILK